MKPPKLSKLFNAASYDLSSKEWDKKLKNSASYIYLERPAMKKLIPSGLTHKNILSIGAGSGSELGELIKQNPSRLAAIDISRELLNIAKDKFPSVEVFEMDMMDMNFSDETFDFVYSSLVFHYAHDWDILMAGIRRVLKKQGLLLFSTHHPAYWSKKETTGNSYTNSRNVRLSEHKTILNAGAEVVYYNHKDTAAIIESVEHAGFEIIETVTPEVMKPDFISPKEKEKLDNLIKNNSKTPLFFIVLARKI